MPKDISHKRYIGEFEKAVIKDNRGNKPGQKHPLQALLEIARLAIKVRMKKQHLDKIEAGKIAHNLL